MLLKLVAEGCFSAIAASFNLRLTSSYLVKVAYQISNRQKPNSFLNFNLICYY